MFCRCQSWRIQCSPFRPISRECSVPGSASAFSHLLESAITRRDTPQTKGCTSVCIHLSPNQLTDSPALLDQPRIEIQICKIRHFTNRLFMCTQKRSYVFSTVFAGMAHTCSSAMMLARAAQVRASAGLRGSCSLSVLG